MTSYTRKLYSRDPAAAVAFHRQSKVERAMATHSQPYDPAKATVCPYGQTYCVQNDLSAHDCPVCKHESTIRSRRLAFMEGH